MPLEPPQNPTTAPCHLPYSQIVGDIRRRGDSETKQINICAKRVLVANSSRDTCLSRLETILPGKRGEILSCFYQSQLLQVGEAAFGAQGNEKVSGVDARFPFRAVDKVVAVGFTHRYDQDGRCRVNSFIPPGYGRPPRRFLCAFQRWRSGGIYAGFPSRSEQR